ncbi:hypothetical protein G7Z17_g7342 [Cylindrodendrum hubeiense]|uniref:WSC domain-containing protein n=1 Tax=Cylindrodendrum hubeiense TaxID=595255 RepID=A0A9P5H358_9HYPO|nr:hypothetical protein G7Z17_g7342 [Cylindrodendrum hubeiense]
MFATAETLPNVDFTSQLKLKGGRRDIADDQMDIKFDGQTIATENAANPELGLLSATADMSYPRSTTMRSRRISTEAGEHTLEFTIYDSRDALRDSALLVSVSDEFGSNPPIKTAGQKGSKAGTKFGTTSPESDESTFKSDQSAISSVPVNVAYNQPRIHQYSYGGCLKSEAGYPTFTQRGQDEKMTPSLCLSLAKGSKYFGVWENLCYAADFLSQTNMAPSERCNLRCAGNERIFCGGLVSPEVHRSHFGESPGFQRNIPTSQQGFRATFLLTLYIQKKDDTPSLDGAAITPPAGAVGLVSKPAPTAPGSVTSTVTMVRYTTVNPADRRYLVIAEFRTTIQFYYCATCHTTAPPSVKMTTCEASCDGCGSEGQDSTMLTVPVEAIAHPTSLYGSFLRTVASTRANPGNPSIPTDAVAYE